MPNSWHKAVKDFSPRLAVTTKLTRCSRTSIVFHGIDQYAPALAALAPECKGCLETFRKGSHGTEQFFVKVGTYAADTGFSSLPRPTTASDEMQFLRSATAPGMFRHGASLASAKKAVMSDLVVTTFTKNVKVGQP